MEDKWEYDGQLLLLMMMIFGYNNNVKSTCVQFQFQFVKEERARTTKQD